ncbi:MAG: diphosphomevalonate decarboxylase [Candidatus Bathyarchaeia archaeon]
MTKATAIAHAIQGLVKYHGLKDSKRRIPYHDSISVCVEELTTKATIEFSDKYSKDIIEINGEPARSIEAARVLAVVSPLRTLAKAKEHFKLSSRNNLPQGKGLGFSASAFASIAQASSSALSLKMQPERLSEIARLGAGSASRSLVGGFSIWYANKNGSSYAEQLPTSKNMNLAMAFVPIPSQVKTDMAHEESVTSPFFSARLEEVGKVLRRMQRAIKAGEVDEIGRLAEADSLSLHAITMTGKSGLVLMGQETIGIIQGIISLRETEHIPVWYSLDTGPSVYINTHAESIDTVCAEIRKYTNFPVLKSKVGGPARTIEDHLF